MKYIFLILSLITFTAYGQSGWKSPTATGEDYTGFTAPNYAYSSDDVNAYVGYADYPKSQDYYNFDFGVPTGATIDSIGTSVELMQNNSNPYYVHCGIELSGNGGSTYTTSGVYDSTNLAFTNQVMTSYGTWGESWTVSELSNANFRVRLTFDGTYDGGPWFSEIDHLQVNVYYTTAGGYSPVAGRDVKIYKAGVEKKPSKNGVTKYFMKRVSPSAEEFTDPIIVFAENFEGISTIDQTQFEIWNASTGGWDQSYVYISQASEHGNVMKIDFGSGLQGEPITDTRFLLDSIYHDIYFQYDIYVPSTFDFGQGGKNFGGFAGGQEVNIPYLGDTINTGFNTLTMFGANGYISWYHYTQNANGFGSTLSSTVQMPSATHAGSSVMGRDYYWARDPGYQGNQWFAWPTRTEWSSSLSKWDYANEPYLGTLPKGAWTTVTQRIRLNDGGNYDIWAFWINGVCKYSKDDNRYRIIDNINWGVEALYINAFFGGSWASPQDQNWLVDNLVAYVLPSGNSEFTASAPYLESTLTKITADNKMVSSPAMPKDERYTEATGTVYSHNHAFHYIPQYITATKMITSAGSTSYTVTMTQYTPGSIYLSESGRNYVQIYKYSGGVSTLIRTYDENDPSLHTDVISSCDSVAVVYYTGKDKPYNSENGWVMTYTSNGAGSGTNPVYPADADMVATKP